MGGEKPHGVLLFPGELLTADVFLGKRIVIFSSVTASGFPMLHWISPTPESRGQS